VTTEQAGGAAGEVAGGAAGEVAGGAAGEVAGEVAGLTRTGAAEWTASGDAEVRAVLADERLDVAPAGAGGTPGTVAWLRASVSRFSTGAEHAQRRALAVAELGRLDPQTLRAAAYERARAELADAAGTGTGVTGRTNELVDVMALLARRVPVAVLATGLGLAEPDRVAAAVIAVAGGYFPAASAEAVSRADPATAWLAEALGASGPEVALARITLMVQACDATAGLIGTALHRLQEAGRRDDRGDTDRPDPSYGPTDALIAETARHQPPVRAIRRVARAAAELGGTPVAEGDVVVCDIDAAGPAAAPDGPPLTFGAGLRPCPAADHARALAAGVVDAVRDRARLRPGSPVSYEPSPALRIPARLDVELR